MKAAAIQGAIFVLQAHQDLLLLPQLQESQVVVHPQQAAVHPQQAVNLLAAQAVLLAVLAAQAVLLVVQVVLAVLLAVNQATILVSVVSQSLMHL